MTTHTKVKIRTDGHRPAGVRIGLLGPVRLWRDGTELDPGPAGRRALLGLLALERGRPMARADIVDVLWPDQQPRTAVNIIHNYVLHLRRLLEPDRPRRAPASVLTCDGDWYCLRVPDDATDIDRFQGLVSAAYAARDRGDHPQAVELFRSGLSLWSGPLAADIPQLATYGRAVMLERERIAAVTAFADSAIATDAAVEALPALLETALLAPLDEELHALLMSTYVAAGQPANAVAVYRDIVRRLAEELEVTPGPALRGAAVAARDALTRTPPTAQRPSLPARMPAPGGVFTGRADMMERLDSIVAAAAPPTVVTISGGAGIGKTTIAAQWAHRNAHRFPDGQLFVNLGGFASDGSSVGTAAALHSLLEALGCPAYEIPADPQARAGLYRSMMAGRRMLVVLDDARDEHHVRPLLPGTVGSVALVTSRNRLAGLISADGAQLLPVGPLPHLEARQLLDARLGSGRLSAEPFAGDDILVACDGLPLALAGAATRVALRPELSLAALAEDLDDPGAALDLLSGPETGVDLRGALNGSYQVLSAPAAHVFRLLGLLPVDEFGADAVARLVATADVRQLLAELAAVHLVTERRRNRYAVPRLVRAYAAERAHAEESAETRLEAVRRLLDHYTAVGRPAAEALTTGGGSEPVGAGIGQSPAAWCATELDALVAAVPLARRYGLERHADTLVTVVDGIERALGRTKVEPVPLTPDIGPGSAEGRLARRAGPRRSVRPVALHRAATGAG